MAISLKHTFQSAKADGADSSLVQPSNWNAEHTITAAAGKVLGRDTSGAGAVQELPIAVDTSGNVNIPNNFSVDGNATLGNASGDSVTVNAATFSFANSSTVSGTLGFSGVVNFSNKLGVNQSSPALAFDVNGGACTNVVAVSASAIDCTTGTYFTKTASGALTWTISNVPSSRAYSFLLELTNGGTGTQTWFSGTKWPGGAAPTLTTSGVDVLGFITDDGGTTWRGVALMLDSK
jgi:hypothetical protein